jgi:hypothetical protein
LLLEVVIAAGFIPLSCCALRSSFFSMIKAGPVATATFYWLAVNFCLLKVGVETFELAF